MDTPDLTRMRDFALEIALEAGRLTLDFFHPDTPFERKSDDSPVTVADRGAEQYLRQRIEREFPTHGILGEEYGEKRGDAPARWILDPIDGTFSFISGVPLFCVLVGFEWRGEMLAGVIHAPALSDTAYAARGLGCIWRRQDGSERTAQTSACDDLSRARLIHTGIRNMYRCGRGAALERLRDAVYADRSWCDAYGYLLIATGRAEIAIDPVMNPWDNAALLPVVTESGGTFTDWEGRSTHLSPHAVATNGPLAERVLAMLRD